MIRSIEKKELISILVKVCDEIESMSEELGKLDAQGGDGDLGVTVKLGISSIKKSLSENSFEDIGKLFINLGKELNKNAPSTFGTLISIGLIRAGTRVQGKNVLFSDDFEIMLDAAINGIKERGNALPGDKTMLDALCPAFHVFKKCNEQGCILEAICEASKAAAEGAEKTAVMTPKHGRAKWMPDQSKGSQDAGAVTIAGLFKSFENQLRVYNNQ